MNLHNGYLFDHPPEGLWEFNPFSLERLVSGQFESMTLDD